MMDRKQLTAGSELCQKAEEIARVNAEQSQASLEAASPEVIQKMLHE